MTKIKYLTTIKSMGLTLILALSASPIHAQDFFPRKRVKVF